jgi:hypothetical protein
MSISGNLNTVACRPVARQWPQDKQLDNGPYTATEKLCFLCAPCEDKNNGHKGSVAKKKKKLVVNLKGLGAKKN